MNIVTGGLNALSPLFRDGNVADPCDGCADGQPIDAPERGAPYQSVVPGGVNEGSPLYRDGNVINPCEECGDPMPDPSPGVGDT